MSEIPDKKYFKLSELCQVTETQPYVVRFWESEFPQLSPATHRSGQRLYSREAVDLVRRIKQLLYEEEFTIAGARRKLEEDLGGGAKDADIESSLDDSPASRPRLVVDAEKLPKPSMPPPTMHELTAQVVPRERYEDAVDEIDHLRTELREGEKQRRKIEAALRRSEELSQVQRERASRAVERLEALLVELDAAPDPEA
jgi:DNA-binding transcriptional MerR regulator